MSSQQDLLRGRVAVVTGSTRGLGFAMARVLGHRGATVVLASRSEVDVAAAVERLRTEGIAASGRHCDTGELADVEALREEALGRGMLDIWVNNAGAAGVFGPTASTPVDDFTRVVRTNILGTFHGSRVALPVFLAQGHGDLVNIYGQGDQGPVALQNAYTSSKRWVRQFTETLRRETKSSGVRVHGMNPGLVMTDMLGHITSQPGYGHRLGGLQIVVGLWGQTADDAARPIVELVTSDAAEYRYLSRTTMVTRGVRNVLAGRLRRANRMPLDVTVLGGAGRD
ncbi:SDR family oxidoreductase [Arthrobacter sp. AL08]|uniref:SDR family NAD(P)-dependent oxidoreductase n=1 Tax=Micrococcaceae TaxID=1268 RepID=UPI001CFF9796|nr:MULTISPECIES: SDR family oxidoreductase [Micrococcaceae]MCB5282470.1 4-formylbenzenesulfonate dehydrogenase TsaC1/TsaC2 [Arthrobacter sp. ES1]MDI3242280.1 SDR family oxidoreductase [Arthrobacter sp. AL05]MDI3278290.1 SDR family oxidoreductase [Arthrobacter sp. AL08]MDJ0351568.1 SDR family oxidoreductase [Pseudarthrobacter sp. PH31-O2]WGZ78073.1 SDR family oxidoreductase [Arthrobacter sp. EM1]